MTQSVCARRPFEQGERVGDLRRGNAPRIFRHPPPPLTQRGPPRDHQWVETIQMSVPNLSHWKPAELLASARHHSLEGFLNKCESPFLLLIKLEDPQGELALGLMSDEPREQNRDSL